MKMNQVIETLNAFHLHTQDGGDTHGEETCASSKSETPSQDVNCPCCMSCVLSAQRDLPRPIDPIEVAKRSHVCPQCQRSFRKRAHLYRHVESIHGAAGLIFECRDGHYRTPRKDNHQRHLRSCTWKNFSNGLFICRCGKGNQREKQHLAHLSMCTFRQKRMKRIERL